jgi:nucleosome binding factor SPN SPT16 subunit
VLNGTNQSAASSQENLALDPTTPSWVTKTDRHLQLINRDVYDREAQQRTRAIEHTHKQKQMDKDRREKMQFFRNMQQTGKDMNVAPSNQSKPASRYEVEVDGVRFHVTQQGSKLVKAPGAFPRYLGMMFAAKNPIHR